MNDKVRVALLGIEHSHSDSWQIAFRESNQSELVGVWSQNLELAKEKSKKLGYAVWDDRDQLLDHVDAVAICSPTIQHLELIEVSARKGKKILCEKPIATSFADCRRIEVVLQETGADYMQGFPKRFDPINHEIKEILERGDLGTVFLVRVRHGHPFAATNPEYGKGWIADFNQAGGGALLDEGVHGADFLRWMFGEPKKVSCVLNNMIKQFDVEETGTALFQFANGMIAEITASWHFTGADNSIEIYGSNGSIVLSGVDLGSRDLTKDGFLKYDIRSKRKGASTAAVDLQERTWQVSKTVPQFKQNTSVFHQNVARAFIDFALQGKEPPVTLQDGIKAVEMILSAYRAAESGKTEEILWG